MKKSTNQSIGRIFNRTAIHTDELIEIAEHYGIEIPSFVRNSQTMICRSLSNIYSSVTNQDLTKEIINQLCDFAEQVRAKVIPNLWLYNFTGSFDIMEEKLIKLLECKFSLHEADELFSMLFDDKFTPEDILLIKLVSLVKIIWLKVSIMVTKF